MDDQLASLLDSCRTDDARVVVLTGAGISAESGIPTFRGKDGYWTVGARNYHPQELATRAAFDVMPDEVWRWYLYRRAVCRAATPNAGHRALAQFERAWGDRFRLVTQNVDGLHQRAGNRRVYAIHGHLDQWRCGHDGRPEPMAACVPTDWAKDRPLDDSTRKCLWCAQHRCWRRPHVLWFDETYSEELFYFDSALRAASETTLLVVVGTSGATNLPLHIGATVARRGAAMVVINRDESPFTEFAEQSPRGFFWRENAATAVPAIVDRLTR
ncbi:MAG: Sir2 family NAD-dependent protein deacetylase [Myxococcota bacterium]